MRWWAGWLALLIGALLGFLRLDASGYVSRPGGHISQPRSSSGGDAGPPQLYMDDAGAGLAILWQGNEQTTGSTAHWGNFVTSPGIANCGNGRLYIAHRRGLTENADYANAHVVGNYTTSSGSGWAYNRVNEQIIEDVTTEDPWSEGIMQLASDPQTLFLTYETGIQGGGPPSRLTYHRTSTDCGATWSARTQFPSVGTSYTSAGGHCIELPWGTGTCPGSGCALLCPNYYRDSGENRYTSIAFLSPAGIGGTFYWAGTVARDSNPSGIQYEEPHFLLLPGAGYCGTQTSTSCVLALIRDDATVTGNYTGTTWQSYSRDSGHTWDAPTVAFSGKGWPDLTYDPGTGDVVVLTRQTPSTNTDLPDAGAPDAGYSPLAGATILYASQDRGQTWHGPTEAGDLSFGSSYINKNQSTSYDYGQLVSLANNKLGMIWSQEGCYPPPNISDCRVKMIYREVYIDQVPPALDFVNGGSWTHDTGATAIYGDLGAWTALHGTAHFACGLWFRAVDLTQTTTLLRYGGATDNTHNSFYLQHINTNPHFELSIAAATNTFERFVSPNNDAPADIWWAFFWLYDGTGTGNTQRLQVALNGDDITSLGTYTGNSATIPATMTSPSGAILRIGATANGGAYLRGTAYDHVACWVGTHAPTRAQYTAARSAWWSDGTPRAAATIASEGWSGPAPDVAFLLDEDLDNSGTDSSLGATSVTGSPVYSRTIVKGFGYDGTGSHP